MSMSIVFYALRLSFIGLIAFVLCGQAAGIEGAIPSVYVTNYPLKYFAERIAGAHARVVFPAPKNVDPAFWVPDLEAVQGYQQAELILLNGAGYEKWIDQVSLPQLKLVDTSSGFRSQYIKLAIAFSHTHGPGGEHTHGGTAVTTWLDFKLAERQAEVVAEALRRLHPELAQSMAENYGALKQDLAALDRQMREIVAQDPQKPLIASHPVYQYLAQGYGLNLRSLHWEPDAPPSEEQWAELKRLLQEHPANWLLWEKRPLAATVTQLKALGVSSLVFDPCANVPAPGDFLSLMRQNLENLKRALKTEGYSLEWTDHKV
ncbi:MAG: metal ABC transporter substrate-binding protein [Gammaproteobacteria bacterium]